FESKDALTAVLIREYVEKLDLSYEAFLEAFPESEEASAILISFVGEIADKLTDKIGYNLIKLAYRIQIDRNNSADVLLSYRRDIYQVFSELIQRGIRRGEFREQLDVKTTAAQLIAVLRGFTYEWCIRYPDFCLKEELLRHFHLLLYGIKK
ncbi:MAG: hypothetical protein PHU31_06360, partial [Anaerotignum sp.]|nr:hypothetical protein [Anaerotignum sp.]